LTEKDIVVIGGGPGGYVAAIHAAHLGAEVAVIEKDRLGAPVSTAVAYPPRPWSGAWKSSWKPEGPASSG
jgi:flavin-dependent dehydrogenase